MNVINPTKARTNFYKLLKQINITHEPIQIMSEKGDTNAVIISMDDWNAIQETLYLQSVGVLDRINEFKDEEVVEIGDVEWDSM